jgi:hypothetical protein
MIVENALAFALRENLLYISKSYFNFEQETTYYQQNDFGSVILYVYKL